MDEIDNEIGTVAGYIWGYLSEHGPSPFVEIKAGLEMSNTMFCLALGWLARENKIAIKEFEHSYMISLK
jgi:hypothetical protein